MLFGEECFLSRSEMAPKPSPKPVAAGKKPTGAISAKGKADAKTPASGDAGAGGDESPTTMAAPKNKEEVLAQVNLDGLPNCPTDAIVEILRGKYETLVSIFINYCKHSDCKTLELSTRLRLGVCQPPGWPEAKEGQCGAASRLLLAVMHLRSCAAARAAPDLARRRLPIRARARFWALPRLRCQLLLLLLSGAQRLRHGFQEPDHAERAGGCASAVH